MSDPTSAYEEVPYLSRALPQTHPDRLAVLATLFGMAPAPADRCRVLELGCADGGNLIPMAFGLPDSEFVGVEPSPSANRRARERIDALGLKNISVHALDVRKLPPDFGRFDYLIANGVYSWVPPDVRDGVLTACRDRLNPHGVAFVSYNTYPGCRQRQAAWEMLRYRLRQVTDARERIAAAREFARYVAEAADRPDPDNQALVREMKQVADHEDFLLYHDELSEVNDPVYFHTFAEHAAQFGLQFLAEAEFYQMQDPQYPPRLLEPLRRLAGGDLIAHQQYLDFLKCRRYRQTLLCRREIVLDRPAKPQRVLGLRVASDTRKADGPPNLAAGVEEPFHNWRGTRMTTSHPPVKAALIALNEAWPHSLTVPELAARVQALLRRANVAPVPGTGPESPVVAQMVVQLYAAGFVELRLLEPRMTTTPGERPVASPVVRLQIRGGDKVLTNLRHWGLTMPDDFARQLVLLLDGTRDRAALLAELAGFAADRAVRLPPAGQPAADARQAHEILTPLLGPSLESLGRLALLVG